MMKHLLTSIAFFLFTPLLSAQPETENSALRKSLTGIISKYKATVGVSVAELETGDTLSINNSTPFAMQSVFKFPLALAVLNEVEKGNISLQQKVLLNKKMLDKFSRSPLKRQNPGSNFYMSVDSLLMYTVAYSDNLSCDVLFELIGGPEVADKFIQSKGFTNIHIKYTEIEIGEKPERMYLNSSTPSEMTALLKAFHERKIISEKSTKYLLNYMINDSTTHKRLLGDLPPGTVVAHKTGTGSFKDSLISACNDIGIIYLPNERHLAVAIFVMDATEKYEQTEKLIAILARKIFDHYNKKN